MNLQFPDIKRCCNNMIKFIIVYQNNTTIAVCDDDYKKIEYRTGIKMILDFDTKKRLEIKEVLS